jgi:hypothetical protein
VLAVQTKDALRSRLPVPMCRIHEIVRGLEDVLLAGKLADELERWHTSDVIVVARADPNALRLRYLAAQ